MRKRTTSRAKETIKEATTKATEAVKETVEKTTVKASEVIEEAKDAAADIAKAPVVEEAKETVKKAVKEVAKNIDIKKFAETTIELPGFAVTMSSTVRKFGEECQRRWGITPLQIFLHKDEVIQN